MQKKCVESTGSYFIVFTLDSIHRIPQRYIIQQNIIAFNMAYSYNNIFVYVLWFFMLTDIIYQKNEYIFGINPKNPSIATPPVSCFFLPTTNLFESS